MITITLFRCPVDSAILTSPYGMRFHPVLHINRLHSGVDLISKNGANVPILATADGIVKLVKTTKDGYGKYVILSHIINGKPYDTLYAHLKSYNVVVGQKVKQGEKIGIMGTTGTSTGVHLHFEIHDKKYLYGSGSYPNSLNPMNYISLTNKVKEAIDLSTITISEMHPTLRNQAISMLKQGYNNKYFNDKDWIVQAENQTLSIANLIGLKILIDSKR